MGENRKFMAIVTATLTQRKTQNVITMDDVVRGLRAAVSDAVERAHLLERIFLLLCANSDSNGHTSAKFRRHVAEQHADDCTFLHTDAPAIVEASGETDPKA